VQREKSKCLERSWKGLGKVISMAKMKERWLSHRMVVCMTRKKKAS